MDAPSDGGSLPRAFFAPGSSSFADFLAAHQPNLLPGRRLDVPAGMTGHIDAPHGTTIVAVVHTQGVVIAGDRRATMGNVIAQRDIEKVFQADEYSGVGMGVPVQTVVDKQKALPPPGRRTLLTIQWAEFFGSPNDFEEPPDS